MESTESGTAASAPDHDERMEASSSQDPAREFLDLWADIEKHLRHKYSLPGHIRTMGEIIAETRTRDALVRRYEPALTAFRDLRNAIVHHPYRGDVPIATPRPDTVDRLRRVHHELLHPAQIGRCLRAPAVSTAAPDDPLRDALYEMAAHSYSQLPVYEDGRYLGLLTTNAVARWLATQISDAGEVLVDQVLVREVLDFVEPTELVVHRAHRVGRRGDRRVPQGKPSRHTGRGHRQRTGSTDPETARCRRARRSGISARSAPGSGPVELRVAGDRAWICGPVACRCR